MNNLQVNVNLLSLMKEFFILDNYMYQRWFMDHFMCSNPLLTFELG